MLKRLHIDGLELANISEQTRRMCLIAVQQNGHALQYVNEQTELICLQAVKQDPDALQYVKNQTIKICEAAVRNNGNALRFVNQTILLDDIEAYTKLCILAIRNYSGAFLYVLLKTGDICRVALKINGALIQHIPDDSILSMTVYRELCKIAVTSRPLSIVWVDEGRVEDHEIYHEICMIAVKNNGLALCYVRRQTERLCIAAIEQNRKAYNYIKIPLTNNILCAIVKKDGNYIRVIDNQTEELCTLAIMQNEGSIQWIKNRTMKLYKLSLSKSSAPMYYVTADKNLSSEDYRELCSYAVRTKDESIQYICQKRLNDPLFYGQLCFEAVKSSLWNLRYVNDFNDNRYMIEICRYVLEHYQDEKYSWIPRVYGDPFECIYQKFNKYKRNLICRAIITDICISLKPLRLPSYVLLNIIDYALYNNTLRHIKKIEQIIRINEECGNNS